MFQVKVPALTLSQFATQNHQGNLFDIVNLSDQQNFLVAKVIRMFASGSAVVQFLNGESEFTLVQQKNFSTMVVSPETFYRVDLLPISGGKFDVLILNKQRDSLKVGNIVFLSISEVGAGKQRQTVVTQAFTLRNLLKELLVQQGILCCKMRQTKRISWGSSSIMFGTPSFALNTEDWKNVKIKQPTIDQARRGFLDEDGLVQVQQLFYDALTRTFSWGALHQQRNEEVIAKFWKQKRESQQNTEAQEAEAHILTTSIVESVRPTKVSQVEIGKVGSSSSTTVVEKPKPNVKVKTQPITKKKAKKTSTTSKTPNSKQTNQNYSKRIKIANGADFEQLRSLVSA